MTDTNTNTNLSVISQMQELSAIKASMSPEQLKFVKNLINPDLTDTELYMFLGYSEKTGLNPFAKEIIPVVYGTGEYRKVNTIVTRDGKRATAYRQGGIESVVTEPIYVKEVKAEDGSTITIRVLPWEGGKLWGATCTVVRDGKTFTATVPLAEYNTNKNVWAGKPETMIKKVAESQALSMAVPELLGVYDEAEMPMDSGAVVALPSSEEDSKPATVAQIKTIEKVAIAKGIKVETKDMTQATARAWIAGINQK